MSKTPSRWSLAAAFLSPMLASFGVYFSCIWSNWWPFVVAYALSVVGYVYLSLRWRWSPGLHLLGMLVVVLSWGVGLRLNGLPANSDVVVVDQKVFRDYKPFRDFWWWGRPTALSSIEVNVGCRGETEDGTKVEGRIIARLNVTTDDEELLKLVRSGKLVDRATIRKQGEQLLVDAFQRALVRTPLSSIDESGGVFHQYLAASPPPAGYQWETPFGLKVTFVYQ